jgi:hypothetical protein
MKVMQEVHESPTTKHHGEKTTRDLLRKTFYWPKLKEDVEHYVHMCVKCERTKLVHKKKFGLYRPLPIPSDPFENVSMDFMTCLPKCEGMDAILVVLHKISKLAKFASTQKTP